MVSVSACRGFRRMQRTGRVTGIERHRRERHRQREYGWDPPPNHHCSKYSPRTAKYFAPLSEEFLKLPSDTVRSRNSITGQSDARRSRSALPMTDTELRLIAAAAIIGFSNTPKSG